MISSLSVFTVDQLALFDGTRKSNPVYLALLGRVYNVEKGRKFYAPPAATAFSLQRRHQSFCDRRFYTCGLTDDVFGLSESELLSIDEWINFYEKEYELVGLLEGTYWTSQGKPTAVNKQVNALIERARAWKEKQVQESEVFPPCNSEWQKETGGRVWCTNKSGGIKRDWVGVPRRLFVSKDKSFRCACVKNFGSSLSIPDSAGSSGNRGDLDNPNLKEYEDCPELANSCRIPAH
uniref:Cytochrome b5 heme-binding domain-containing protein n=1 Tax=Ditylenchus dipsaci TaxID=166011 RepID=A0A915EAR8_9BILA